jgi:trigger factor
LDAIAANSQIKYPQGLLDYYTAQIKDYYTQLASYYSMDFASFLTASGKTEDQFNTDAQTYAQTMSSQELIIKAVIETEKMELTDQEYQDGVAKLATDYGYSSSDEFLKNAAESDIRESLLWQKTLDFVTEQAVVK